MAGTIIVDRIESDASYASTINVANRITFSNTVNFGVFAGTAPVAGFYLPTTNNLAFTTASTERMRIDSSGNVGIGTASPGAKFSLTSTGSTTADGVRLTFGSEARAHNIYSALPTGRDLTIAPYRALTINTGSGTAEGVLALNAYEYTTFGTGSSYTERMRIDSSGNVGIGTSSPSTKLHVVSSSGENKIISEATAASQQASLSLIVQAATPGQTVIYMGKTGATTNGQLGYDPNTDTMTMYTNNAERMRINSSGQLFVGTTTFASGQSGVFMRGTNSGGSDEVLQTRTAGTGSTIATGFYNNNGRVGTISTVGSATAYNTSSDYRLKESISPMTAALAKVALLKPCTYKWKVDGSDGQGFIAHELDEVVSGCVTGEKDAVDADGKPVYQGIDTSFLVATLTAAIQEQQALIQALTTRITALESN